MSIALLRLQSVWVVDGESVLECTVEATPDDGAETVKLQPHGCWPGTLSFASRDVSVREVYSSEAEALSTLGK